MKGKFIFIYLIINGENLQFVLEKYCFFNILSQKLDKTFRIFLFFHNDKIQIKRCSIELHFSQLLNKFPGFLFEVDYIFIKLIFFTNALIIYLHVYFKAQYDSTISCYYEMKVDLKKVDYILQLYGDIIFILMWHIFNFYKNFQNLKLLMFLAWFFYTNYYVLTLKKILIVKRFFYTMKLWLCTYCIYLLILEIYFCNWKTEYPQCIFEIYFNYKDKSFLSSIGLFLHKTASTEIIVPTRHL